MAKEKATTAAANMAENHVKRPSFRFLVEKGVSKEHANTLCEANEFLSKNITEILVLSYEHPDLVEAFLSYPGESDVRGSTLGYNAWILRSAEVLNTIKKKLGRPLRAYEFSEVAVTFRSLYKNDPKFEHVERPVIQYKPTAMSMAFSKAK